MATVMPLATAPMPIPPSISRPSNSLSPQRFTSPDVWDPRSTSRAPLVRSLSRARRRDGSVSKVTERDWRSGLPGGLGRFLGWRGGGVKGAGERWVLWLPLKVERSIMLPRAVTIQTVILLVLLSLAAFNPPFLGSLGATATLLFALPLSPVSSPRNVIGGHMVAVASGIAVGKLADRLAHTWFGVWRQQAGGTLALVLTLLGQLWTGTLHPPGGATALLALINSTFIDHSGMFALEALSGATISCILALSLGNLGRGRYPLFWWSEKRREPWETVRDVLKDLSLEAREEVWERAIEALGGMIGPGGLG